MIDGLSLAFFVPLVVHALAGLTTGVTGVLTFRAPKAPGPHHRWGGRYLWAYTVVFVTAIILSAQRWPADAYLVLLATLGYSSALTGYLARRYREAPWMPQFMRKYWIVVHVSGMIGSYDILWTAFYVDNAHLIPGLERLPTLVFWLTPTLVALLFLTWMLTRYAPQRTGSNSQEASG